MSQESTAAPVIARMQVAGLELVKVGLSRLVCLFRNLRSTVPARLGREGVRGVFSLHDEQAASEPARSPKFVDRLRRTALKGVVVVVSADDCCTD